jgi:dynein assembly factor 2
LHPFDHKWFADPAQVKAETDLYLRQLEAEGRGEEVYGKGTLLVLPKEAYVIKTQVEGTGQKVFINVCTSDKVDKLSMEPVKGPGGKVGRNVQIPLTLSSKKTGKDKAGQPCLVWDFVVHPDTVEAAAARPAIRKLLAETVSEKHTGCWHRAAACRLGQQTSQLSGLCQPHVQSHLTTSLESFAFAGNRAH